MICLVMIGLLVVDENQCLVVELDEQCGQCWVGVVVGKVGEQFVVGGGVVDYG